MSREVKLSRISRALESLSYPISRSAAVAELEDVTLLLADGEANLGEIVARTGSARFDNVEDLESEVYGVLPIEAVGEPGQSEGEG